jgi:hypothetical protein
MFLASEFPAYQKNITNKNKTGEENESTLLLTKYFKNNFLQL